MQIRLSYCAGWESTKTTGERRHRRTSCRKPLLPSPGGEGEGHSVEGWGYGVRAGEGALDEGRGLLSLLLSRSFPIPSLQRSPVIGWIQDSCIASGKFTSVSGTFLQYRPRKARVKKDLRAIMPNIFKSYSRRMTGSKAMWARTVWKQKQITSKLLDTTGFIYKMSWCFEIYIVEWPNWAN